MVDTAQVTGTVMIGSTSYDVGTLNFTLTGGTPPPSPPGQVTGLTSSGVTVNSFNLAWNAVSGASSYVVQSKTGSGNFATIATPSASNVSVTGLNASTAYVIRVAAVNNAGQGTYSNELTVTTSTPSGGGGTNIFQPDFSQALDGDWGYIYNSPSLRLQQNYKGVPSLWLRKHWSHGFYQIPQQAGGGENEAGAVPVVYRKGYRDGGTLKKYKLVNGLKIQFRSGFVKNNYYYPLGQGGVVLFTDDVAQAEATGSGGFQYTKIDQYVKYLPQEYAFGDAQAHPVYVEETNGVRVQFVEAPIIGAADCTGVLEVINGRINCKYRYSDTDSWTQLSDLPTNIALGSEITIGFYAETDHNDDPNGATAQEYVFFQNLIITTPVS